MNSDKAAQALHAVAAMGVCPRSLHDQHNNAELEQLLAKFGPTTSSPDDPAQLPQLAGGPISSKAQ